jgi:SAM-dependent methyltransferase
MSEIFSAAYAVQYDYYSSLPPKPYDRAAQALVEVDGGIRDGETIVEIGSGTGNSTIVLGHSNPQLARLICVEPSAGFLDLAKYKFGFTEAQLPDNTPLGARDFIERQRQAALGIREKVTLLQGASYNIPLVDDVADRVYCPQSFHWFAFPDQKSDPDFKFLHNSLFEISRVLKSHGRLLFDSNGHIFDFQGTTLNGRDLNEMHLENHPIYRIFRENFSSLVSSDTTEAPKDRLHHIFNMGSLTIALEQGGFEPIQVNNEDCYKLTTVPYDRDSIITITRYGAKMTYFSKPGLLELPETEKDALVEEALRKTLIENEGMFEKDYYEVFIDFAFQKASV